MERKDIFIRKMESDYQFFLLSSSLVFFGDTLMRVSIVSSTHLSYTILHSTMALRSSTLACNCLILSSFAGISATCRQNHDKVPSVKKQGSRTEDRTRMHVSWKMCMQLWIAEQWCFNVSSHRTHRLTEWRTSNRLLLCTGSAHRWILITSTRPLTL